MSAWQKSGKRVRQAIGMILVRSKKPVILKAGKLIHLTLDTFISVSFSNFVLTYSCLFLSHGRDSAQRKLA